MVGGVCLSNNYFTGGVTFCIFFKGFFLRIGGIGGIHMAFLCQDFGGFEPLTFVL